MKWPLTAASCLTQEAFSQPRVISVHSYYLTSLVNLAFCRVAAAQAQTPSARHMVRPLLNFRSSIWKRRICCGSAAAILAPSAQLSDSGILNSAHPVSHSRPVSSINEIPVDTFGSNSSVCLCFPSNCLPVSDAPVPRSERTTHSWGCLLPVYRLSQLSLCRNPQYTTKYTNLNCIKHRFPVFSTILIDRWPPPVLYWIYWAAGELPFFSDTWISFDSSAKIRYNHAVIISAE